MPPSLLDAYETDAVRVLPVVLLLDTSGSMREDDKIEVLNDSVTEMIDELTEVDAGNGAILLSIVTFGGDSATFHERHKPVGDIEFSSLSARGRTPMGEAFRAALELVEDHEALPSSSYRPTIALVSDGLPTDHDWEAQLDALVESDRGSKSTRFALAIGADADRGLLGRFTGETVHEASEAAEIRKFLQFVTTTVTQITLSLFDPDSPTLSVSDNSIVQHGDDDY